MPRVDADSYERLIPIEGHPVDMLNPPRAVLCAPVRARHEDLPAEDASLCGAGRGHRSACWLRVQERRVNARKEAGTND